eukprot:1161966-Pelagomonas_calceolata.AAC.4
MIQLYKEAGESQEDGLACMDTTVHDQHGQLVQSNQAPLAVPDQTLNASHMPDILLEEVAPEGEDLAIVRYKLGTFYYVQDMLHDAESLVRRAGEALRQSYPDDSDLVSLAVALRQSCPDDSELVSLVVTMSVEGVII